MSYTTITVPPVGEATKASLIQLIADNFDDHETRITLLWGAGIVNGGFESGLDGWATDTAGGGTVASETGTFFAGTKACKITLGSSNKYAEIQSGETDLVADFVPVGAGQRIEVNWAQKASVANIRSKAWLRWFNSAGTQVGSDELIFSTDDAPTSWTLCAGSAAAPTGAKYYRLKLRGGDATSAAGSIYYDAVSTEIFRGHVWIAATEILHKHVDEDGTYTLDLRTLLSTSELPKAALIEVTEYEGGGVTPITGTPKGWVGGAWAARAAAHPIPCDPTGQIQMVVSSSDAADYVTVNCVGYIV